MNFYTISIQTTLYHVWLETDEIHACIAEISKDSRKGWTLHTRSHADILKDNATTALKAFAAEQINALKILERLTT